MTPVETPAASADEPAPSPSTSAPPEDVLVVAAGDIASCDYDTDSATAELVRESEPIVVAALGDLVYPEGATATYADCWAPAWGEFDDIVRPALGNHDVASDGGAAFHAYFGDAAGEAGRGWYSYDVGAWHVVVLNSNCGRVDCDPGSDQVEWLRSDLAASDAPCTLAYWHHPRFSSARHGNDPDTGPFWDVLWAAGADVILAGHDHLYERFGPQDPDAEADGAGGIRQFTAGTGGKGLYDVEEIQPNSEMRIVEHGILRLVLGADGYAWSFVTIGGEERDAGEDRCH